MRDPRALISLYKTEKQQMHSQSERICKLMSKNIEDGSKIPDQFYKKVRYEDFIENPLNIIEDVLNFVGLDKLRVEILNRIKPNLIKKASNWKKEMNWEDIKIVQDNCVEVLNALKYNIFNSSNFEN